MASRENGTGSRHDSAATHDVGTHESLVATSERARSRSGWARECMTVACPLPRAESHYVVKRSEAAGTDTRVHKNGAG
jgi:dTDP-glucose pyrophosphorylase